MTLAVVHTLLLDRAGGGIARVVPQLAAALASDDCRVTVLALGGEGTEPPPMPGRATLRLLHAARVAGRPVWARGFLQAARAALADGRGALLHDNGMWSLASVLAARTARRLEVPLVISPHGMLEPWAVTHRNRRKQLAMSLYQGEILASARMLLVSADSEAAAVRRAGLRQPVAIVPPGVVLPEAIAPHAAQATTRRALFLSRLHPVKGLPLLLEAWAALRPVGWELWIAGPDEAGHRAELERQVQQLHLGSVIRFLGPADEARKQELYLASDLFVLPTRSENFGLVIAEALAHGLPVLTTTGAPWPMLEELGAGWWVGGDVEALRAGLARALATTADQRRAMGLAGRAFAGAQLGWARAAGRTREAYEWLLQPALRPAHVHLD